MPNEQACNNCAFFSRHSSGHDYGYCKRRSPFNSQLRKPDQGPDLLWHEYCQWPNVNINNWCGDWTNDTSTKDAQ